MGYSKDELIKLGAQDLEEARRKIVDLKVFDYIDDLKLESQTQNMVDYTTELYQEYLDLLNEFSKTNLDKVLKSLRNLEIIDNHSLECENPNLLKSYQETHHSTAINYLIRRLISEGSPLDDNIIQKAHEILMRGTNQSVVNPNFRNNNNFFVGYVENGVNEAFYYPISYDDIKRALDLFYSYYNQAEHNSEELFVKPFICHGLLAALQVFEDGNTRLSRTLQHIKMFELTQMQLDNNLELPAIYFSRTYLPYRAEYRDLIAKLAINPNPESWNLWIRFNLHRLQDQIFNNNDNFARTRKK